MVGGVWQEIDDDCFWPFCLSIFTSCMLSLCSFYTKGFTDSNCSFRVWSKLVSPSPSLGVDRVDESTFSNRMFCLLASSLAKSYNSVVRA